MSAATESTLRRALIGILIAVGMGLLTSIPRAEEPPGLTGENEAIPPATLAPLRITNGDATLLGTVYIAEGAGPHPTVVLLHGFPGSELNLDLAHAIRRAGWNVAYFHYRGTWGSGGEFSFGNALDDVEAVLKSLRGESLAGNYRIDTTRIALIGHSFGGFLALKVASTDPGISCVAAMAPGNLGLYGQMIVANPELGKVNWDLIDKEKAVRGYSGQQSALDLEAHAEDWDLRATATALSTRPVLLLHGARDQLVRIVEHQMLVEAFEAAGADRFSSLVLPTDHYFSTNRMELADHLIGWLAVECK